MGMCKSRNESQDTRNRNADKITAVSTMKFLYDHASKMADAACRSVCMLQYIHNAWRFGDSANVDYT